MGRQLLHILALILLTVVANATQGAERTDNLVTWVYDGISFTPVAKVAGGERYTIVHDYLGTPVQAYDSRGDLVWEMLLDVYGAVMESRGDRSLVPFRYQGQYEDEDTGLYYNRFRHYSPQMGMYISSDPIGLAGNNPTLYGYVGDVNTWLDKFGLKKGIHGVAPDYETKGLHGTFDDIELSVKSGQDGELSYRKVFSSDGGIDKAVKAANNYFEDPTNIKKALHNLEGSKQYYDKAGKGREWRELKRTLEKKLKKCLGCSV